MIVLTEKEEYILVSNLKLTPYKVMREELRTSISNVKNKIRSLNKRFSCETRSDLLNLARKYEIQYQREKSLEIVTIKVHFKRRVTK